MLCSVFGKKMLKMIPFIIGILAGYLTATIFTVIGNVAAIDALLEGQRNVMIGSRNNEIVYIPFTKAIKDDKPLDRDAVRAQEILAS